MRPLNIPLKSSWTATRLGMIIAGAILGFAIVYTYYQGHRAKPPAPGALPENVMQANINLLDGQTKKLADYQGKVLVVDLWATWCGPCRQEIPHLVAIANEYKDRGVEVIGLTNEDPETDSEMVKQFSEMFKINYPIGWADVEMQRGLMQGRNGIPQTYIIGRDGTVLKRFVGFNPSISIPQMKAVLEQAVSAG
jgi:cytochrome c biogenesis protein CcmG, thiol:disulfide interchange protein DsbE